METPEDSPALGRAAGENREGWVSIERGGSNHGGQTSTHSARSKHCNVFLFFSLRPGPREKTKKKARPAVVERRRTTTPGREASARTVPGHAPTRGSAAIQRLPWHAQGSKAARSLSRLRERAGVRVSARTRRVSQRAGLTARRKERSSLHRASLYRHTQAKKACPWAHSCP